VGKLKDPKRDIQDFFWQTIFLFYEMGLQTSGKKIDDVISGDDGALFWRRKNGATRTFGKRLNQLLKQKR